MPFILSEQVQRVILWLPLCGQDCRKWIVRLLYVFLLAYSFHQYYRFQWEFTQWDALLISGVATLIFGLRLAETVPERLKQCLSRLSSRNAIKFTDNDVDGFFTVLEERADLWARVIALLSAIAMGIAFILVLLPDYDPQTALLALGEVIAAYIGGAYLGRMACYGQLGWIVLKESIISVNVSPLHVDGVGGLKPVGDFFFFQATVAAIPAIFLGVWRFIFPVWPRDYQLWEDPYVFLLSIAILIEILAFVVPLWSFHKIMVMQKRESLAEADEVANEIAELQGTLKNYGGPGNARSLAEQQLELLSHKYWAIENMSTWPVDVKTRRRFQLNNFLLFIPLIVDISNRNSVFTSVLELIRNVTT